MPTTSLGDLVDVREADVVAGDTEATPVPVWPSERGAPL